MITVSRTTPRKSLPATKAEIGARLSEDQLASIVGGRMNDRICRTSTAVSGGDGGTQTDCGD
jgi:hypothetical protein